ncbi:type B 50S ribosomal protein L31 [Enemella sp. A6]|uniref:type B 50S ribosomal protein L31 n=1 Tax=Enemella sp. A6 TaxID=3440152 RepID=UPI003EBF6A77
MKKNTHPRYQPVVFRDSTTGDLVLTRSTMTSEETVEYEGRTYPLIRVDVTAASHPFWTGRHREIDTEGRVERFRRRYGQQGRR